MSKQLTVLITNDDGIHAPGIRHLWHILKDVFNVIIIAPSDEQSGVGLCMTLRQPLHVKTAQNFGSSPAWSVSGTPVDCIKIGLSRLINYRPDMIVSGINRGTNSGRNVLYSGTVGGAIEGVMRDIPSIAFSCYDAHPNYGAIEQYIPPILQHTIDHPMAQGSFLNVNFPPDLLHPIRGFKLTRQGKEHWTEDPDKRYHPTEQQAYYWMGGKLAKYEEESDCDVTWLQQGYVTAVPIQISELTDHQRLKTHKTLFEQITSASVKKS